MDASGTSPHESCARTVRWANNVLAWWEDLWFPLVERGKIPRLEDYPILARRFSAVAAARQILSQMSAERRSQLRKLILEEDRQSVSSPSCHLKSLLPFLSQNPRLVVERRVRLGDAFLLELRKDRTEWKMATVGTVEIPEFIGEAVEWLHETALVLRSNDRLSVIFEGSYEHRQEVFLVLLYLAKALYGLMSDQERENGGMGDQKSAMQAYNGRGEIESEMLPDAAKKQLDGGKGLSVEDDKEPDDDKRRVQMDDLRDRLRLRQSDPAWFAIRMGGPSAWLLRTMQQICKGQLAISFGFPTDYMNYLAQSIIGGV